MSLFINTNVSSLLAQRAAQRANDKLDVSYERLASGLRINSAKDDAAGIQVADNLTTQLDNLTQGNRNAQDAIAFAQTIEGALDEVTNMLQRIRTLSVQAANGTYSDKDREALQSEVTALTDEICRIANDTTFAGDDMLNGNASIVRFQVGADPSSIITIDLRANFSVEGIAAQAAKYSGNTFDYSYNLTASKPLSYAAIFGNNEGDEPGINISTQSSAQAVLGGIDALISAVDRKRSDLGAMQNRLEATVRNQESIKENVSNSRATIRDTDFAEETSILTSQQIIQQATASILVQANQRPQVALNLLNS